jgi:glutamine amidotransferase
MAFAVRIVVLATGVGNVRSVLRALEHTAASASATATATASVVESTIDPDVVRRADVLVVPGQGSFGAFAAALAGGLDEALRERVRAGAAYLGICLGLQVLFESSEEAPGARGLGVLRGAVRLLEPGSDPRTGRQRPLPHVGWNRAEPRDAAAAELLPAAHYYFAHSYAAVPESSAVTIATTEYGTSFASAVADGNVLGVQFHPEKSQRAGIALLGRFLARAREGG